jgi:hypothetical protein
MIGSPYHSYSGFTVNERGTDDIEEELKKSSNSGKKSTM